MGNNCFKSHNNYEPIKCPSYTKIINKEILKNLENIMFSKNYKEQGFVIEVNHKNDQILNSGKLYTLCALFFTVHFQNFDKKKGMYS